MIKGASYKEEQAQPRDPLKKSGAILGSWPVKATYVKKPVKNNCNYSIFQAL